MDRIRQYQILNILLMPYRELEFCKSGGDRIAAVRYAFAKLQRRRELSVSDSKRYEKQYYEEEQNLNRFLQKHVEFYSDTLDDARLLLNLFFPEDEIAEIYHNLWENGQETECGIEFFYLHNIHRISRSLLTFRDGKIAIRTWISEENENGKDIFFYPNVFDKVEVWNLLGRMVTPDIFIAAFFLESGLKDPAFLYRQTGGILLADKSLEKILEKGIAETHLHFNAGIEYLYIWQEYMNFRKWENPLISERKYEMTADTNKAIFPLVVYRMLWAEFLESDFACRFDSFLEKKYGQLSKKIRQILEIVAGEIDAAYDSEWKMLHQELRRSWEIEYGGDEKTGDYLLYTLYRKYRVYQTGSEMILLMKSLLYFEEHADIPSLHLFFQYIRYKNIYLSQVIQSNHIQGLKNFQMFYGRMGRAEKKFMEAEERYKNIFKSLSVNSHLQKLEIRISPDLSFYSALKYYDYESSKRDIRRKLLLKVQKILLAYIKYMNSTVGAVEDKIVEDPQMIEKLFGKKKEGIPSIGILFHFIKEDYVDNRIGDMCWIAAQEEKVSSKHLLIWRKAMTAVAVEIETLRSTVPLFAKYVVGIDAASEENKAEPWIFAPVYSAARSRMSARPLLIDDKGESHLINNLGFTFHVGEEFRHLLSGLRHIAEVIRHFHYKAGDRLGHAIALGTDVEYWASRNEVVVIPIAEQLENLVWVWGRMVHGNWDLPVSAETLEGKILELAKDIYGEIIGLSADVLYDAYMEKFNLEYQSTFEKMIKYKKKNKKNQNSENQNNENEDDENENNENHFCKFYDTASRYTVIWTKKKILCTYFCPVYYQKLRKPIMVHIEKKDISLLKKIQEYIIHQIEQTGIYVEVNPTSNTAIGPGRGLYEGHILNLNSRGLSAAPAEEHEVMITVNSDDPLVFNTNIENELAYIYHELIYKGYKKERILAWIDKVRNAGIESSFIKEYTEPAVMYRELGQLLDEIEAQLKKS